MHHIAIFNLLLLSASGYAFTRGGVPERLCGLLLLMGGLATRLLYLTLIEPYFTMEVGVLVVDALLLIALVILALYADRFWPIWLAALQALGMAAHVVKVIDPSVLRLAYAILVTAWSYPMVIILAVATLRHQRRLRHVGSDLDWSVR